MMNSKERARMARLERENALLREEIAKHMRVYGDTLVQLIELKARLDAVSQALHEDDAPVPQPYSAPMVRTAPPAAGVANW